MIFVVRHLSQGVVNAEFVLPKGGIIRFGSGGDVDFELTAFLDFPSVCAHIWNGDEGYDGCILENISRRDSLVFLNGNSVYSVALLEGGDVIQIGMDRFEIFCRKEKTVPAVSPAPGLHRPEKIDPPQTLVPGIDYTLQKSTVNTALQKFTPIDTTWTQSVLLTQICRSCRVILFANYRLAGVDPTAPELAGPDRYQDAPEEVREMYSLHAVMGGTPGQMLQIVDKLRTKDAVIIALPEGDAETCLAESKLYWGWFARPSVLEMSLTRGSRELCKKIMEPFRGLLVKPQVGSADWVLYTKPESTIEDLLFPETTILMT